jgi:uncharacterized protein (TIGR02266 family)
VTDLFQIVERRTKTRVETKLKVRLVEEGGEFITYPGNLSKSGLFIETQHQSVEKGEKVELEVRLPNASDDVKILGKVTRIVGLNKVGSTPGIGIEFLKIEARHARTFERLIDRLIDSRGIGSRHYPRVKTQVVVEFQSRDKVYRAISDNFSKGGIFLKIETQGLSLGDPIHLVILHPTTGQKFAIDAEIVHIRKGSSPVDESFIEGVGIRFADLTPTRQHEMSLFLRSLVSSQKKKGVKRSSAKKNNSEE